MFRTLGPGDSISVALRKVLQGGRRGSQPIYKFATKGKAVWISKIRYQVKEFSVLFLGRCKPLDSLDSFLPYGSSAIWGQPCFFVHLKEQQMAASCFSQLLSNHHGEWQHPLGHSFGSPHSHLEARNCWWLSYFLFTDMAGDIFISQTHGKNPILYVLLWDVTSPVFNLFLVTRLGCEFQSGTLACERE